MKEDLRCRLLNRRDLLCRSNVQELSEKICRRFFGLDILKEVERLALYAPIRNEVDTELISRELSEMGKEIFYPRIESDQIGFFRVESLAELKAGRWGIQEPSGGTSVRPKDIDLFVVPGVVFDEAGHRIGFGKGYYDRVLGDYEGIKVGLAYDFQVLKEIPVNDWDLRCDNIVTESRWIELE